MPTPPLTDEVLIHAVAVRDRHATLSAAADELGLSWNALYNRLRRAAERGHCGTKPVLPGFRISQVTNTPRGDFVQQKPERGEEFKIPLGQRVKGVSALLDPNGRKIIEWVKTGLEPSSLDVADILAKRFENYEPAALPTPSPAHTDPDLLNLVPCNDWHVGMFAWSRETGANWDLKIARRVLGQGILDAIARSPDAHTTIVLGGGDLTHADNNSNRTPASHHQLDVDGRHQKVVELAGELMVDTIDAALRKSERVIVRNLKGNHDEETAPAVAWFLRAWYRNEPRVTVDLDQSLFFYHPFGKVFIAATHGHAAKLTDMPQIMAHRRPEDWGATRFRYAHGFHVHHKSKFATEGGGVVMESHQAPIPQDAWHFGSGFLSGRSFQTITYHREYGETSRVRVAVLDGDGA